MHTSATLVWAAKSTAARYVSCLRLTEILVLQGSPLLGAAFVLGAHPDVSQLRSLALLMGANVCLVAHVFALNDWANLTADRSDRTKAAWVFTARGVGDREMAALALALLLVSLMLFSRLGPVVLLLGLGIAALSAMYSLPQFNWKGRAPLNSIAHLAGGVLHFLLGYALGSAIDHRGLVMAAFFGITFAAGHLVQEIRDHDGDVISDIRTNAVTFGVRRAFYASLTLFTLSQLLLFGLAVTGTLPRPLAALALLYPLQLRWSLRAMEEGLGYESVCRLQQRYRGLYAVIGVALIGALAFA